MSNSTRAYFARIIGQAALEVDGTRPMIHPAGSDERRDIERCRLLHAFRRGKDLAEVGRLAGLSDRQAQEWAEALSEDPNHELTSENGEPFPSRRPSETFAWLLGLHAAIRRSPAGNRPRPLRVRLSQDEAVEAAAKLKDLFGREPTMRPVDGHFDVFFGNKELSRYLHDISDGNRRIPWEHLGTQEERRAFLSSFLKRRCSLSAIGGVRPILAVGKRMHTGLRDDLLILFSRFGIYPAFDDARIFLQALPELRRLLQAGLISVPRRRQRLARLIDQAPFDSLDTEIERYYRVLDGSMEDAVPAETRRRWLLDELPPKIKRLERLAEVLLRAPDPEVIAYAYRKLNLSSEAARSIAHTRTLSSLLEIVEVLREARAAPSQWREWLQLPQDELARKIGATAPAIVVGDQSYTLTPKARIRYLQAYGLQPKEYEDFSVCLDHIRDELSEALAHGKRSGRVASSSLVFSINGQSIHSIRLAASG